MEQQGQTQATVQTHIQSGQPNQKYSAVRNLNNADKGTAELNPVLEKIHTMMHIQNRLNTNSYDSAWIERGRTEEFDYAMAAGDEAHEFARSLPFQWWRNDKPDFQNQVTELVDAWHFVMSQLIIDMNGNVGLAILEAFRMYEDAQITRSEPTIQKQTKLFVAALYSHNTRFQIECSYVKAFFLLCAKASVSIHLLSARYLGKSVLNRFRVENGYKEGTYHKIWTLGSEKGEDNYFLSQWIDGRLANGEPAPDEVVIHEFLTKTYSEFLESTSPAK